MFNEAEFERAWNLTMLETGALDGQFHRYKNKVFAYLKKNDIEFTRVEEYLKKYTESDFDTLILRYYDIKPPVTPENIQKAKRKTNNKVLTEHEIQKEVCKYLDSKKYKYWAVPNGFVHNDNKIATAKYINYMKAEGLRKGTPDMTILPNNGKVAFLEIKTEKGKPSEEQLEWKKYFDENGYIAGICKGLDECKDFIDKL